MARPERRLEVKKTLTILVVATALIVVASTAAFALLSAYAGEKSGLHRCPALGSADVRAVTDPGYGTRLAEFARCRASQGGSR
jgi:hypothetical protein